MRSLGVPFVLLLTAACASHDAVVPVELPAPIRAEAATAETPVEDSYLHEWPGLFERQDGRIVRAREADVAVARAYPDFAGKGPLASTGERLTIMTAKSTYADGEPIRVIHVHEASRPGVELFVAGPKPIYGETINGEAVSPTECQLFVYDGPVIPAPAVDYNYEVTEYRLPPGEHVIRWSQRTIAEGSLQLTSNELRVRVK